MIVFEYMYDMLNVFGPLMDEKIADIGESEEV